MTDPLVPPDADLRDFHFMPLDVARLIDSDFVAIASGDEFKAAVVLWCKSWHQVPAASLPNDDRLLAHLAGYGRDLKGWKTVRVMALKGFVLCSDGRLYHPVVAEKALEAVQAKRARQERTAAATAAREARRAQRDDSASAPRGEQRNVPVDVQRDVARNVHQGTGTGTGTGTIREDDGMTARAKPDIDQVASLLYSIPELAAQPVLVDPVIAPIWKMVQNGFDVETQIVPSIRRQAAAAKRPIRRWGYFVDGIQGDAQDSISNPTATGNTGNVQRSSNRRPTPADEMRDAVDAVRAHAKRRDKGP